jgi:hypothetical protein
MTRLLSIAALACCGALIGTGPLAASERPAGIAAPAVVSGKHHKHHKHHHHHAAHPGHHAASTTQI